MNRMTGYASPAIPAGKFARDCPSVVGVIVIVDWPNNAEAPARVNRIVAAQRILKGARARDASAFSGWKSLR
jgi:hypothetical protein